jgi:hypothetical protein
MRRITAAMLASKGACANQLRKFQREWPHGATVNGCNASRAAKLGLDPLWMAQKFLRLRALRAYMLDVDCAYLFTDGDATWRRFDLICWAALWPRLLKA